MNRTYEKGQSVYTTRFPFPGVIECEVIAPADEKNVICVEVKRALHIDPREGKLPTTLRFMLKGTLFSSHQDNFFPDLETLFVRLAKFTD